ncbi:hypothetical protein HAX54_015150 [Datura stramonium]|uniref:Uncharacterized protein n=1 Tax=Datura stramonium TaxID=4076 RepID=A0ABS8RZ95_DATST|nr:hypothetical protein [Datura stramonium]
MPNSSSMITNQMDNRIKNRTDLKNMKKFEIKSVSDYTAAPPRPSLLEASPPSSVSNFDSSDQSWSPSSRKSSSTFSRTSSFRNVKILINKSSSKSKRSSSNCQQVLVKSTCSSTLKDSKFPQQVELYPGQNELDRISKVKVYPYHHCSLNRCCDDRSPPVKCVYKRRRVLKSQKSSRLQSESTNANHFSIEESNLIQDGEIFGENEVIEYVDLVEIAFGETSFPERSYQEIINIMRKYST